MTFAASSGTLTLSGNRSVVASLNGTAAGTVVQNVSGTPATLTVGNSHRRCRRILGVIQDGAGGGALSLVKAGRRR